MSTTRYFLLKRQLPIVVIVVTVIILLNATVSTPFLKTLGPGADAPEFNLPDQQAQVRNFSELLGKKLTILVFWSSWSKKSEEAMVQMQQLYTKEAAKGLAVVGINVERQDISQNDLKQAATVFEKLKLTYPNLIDHNLETFHAYGVIAVPTIIVIDGAARIVFEMSGYPLVKAEELGNFVKESMGGKPRAEHVPEAKAYDLDKTAVRYYNLGLKAQKSVRTAASAENYLQKAIAADPGFGPPYLALARLYRHEGKKAEAQEQLQKVLAINPGSAAALFESGMVSFEEGKFAEAVGLFEQTIAAEEYFTPAYYMLGYLSGRKGDLKTAETFFGKAEEQNPMDYKIDLYRGEMYEVQGNLEKATAAYRHSLQLLLGIP